MTERVHLRFIAFPCCGHQLYWIGSRLPTYCSECGAPIYARVREGEGILFSDANAVLQYDDSKMMEKL